ncbi:MAG TPA: LacI family transcriptional regulator [Firmicutes bacterium]|nr:LacI family transcriptional regulator [Bacillota bacterium]
MAAVQVTVRDVAKKAEVSISTVSRVLTGNARVSPELRQRVIEAVEELGYRPNALARGLRMRRTAVIGLLIPDISNPFFGQLARVVEDAANNRGYAILLCNSQNSRRREIQYLDLLRTQQVDGVLVVTSGAVGDQLDEFFKLTGAAVLALDRRIPQFGGPWIGVDPYPGAKEAVRHLLELGHRRIGVVRGVEGSVSSDERYNAIARALDESGLPQERWIWSGEYTLETGVEAGVALAQLPDEERPTAVITTSEFSAYGLIEGASRHGISVPEQLSVVGYDNTAFAEVFRPALTVIAQPIEEMGTLAVDSILRLINAEQEPQLPPVAPVAGALQPRDEVETVEDAVLPTFLVKRSSTAVSPHSEL